MQVWPAARCAAAPAAPTAAAGDAAKQKQEQAARLRWQEIVKFYGEEESGTFSLRVLDQDATEEAQFTFVGIWKYDRDKKQWAKMSGAPRREVKIVPADKKPADGPVGGQIVSNLPVTAADVGLFYAKWEVNGLACVTYARLGPRARERSLPGKPPPRHKVEDVPIDTNRAELAFIPDPRFFADETPATGPGK